MFMAYRGAIFDVDGVLVADASDAKTCHPARLGRLNPAGGVLHHEAAARRNAQLRGGGKEDRRVRLAAREVPPGDVGVEQLLQGHPLMDEVVAEALLGGEGVEPDPFEEQFGVLSTRTPPRPGCRCP